MIRTHGNGKFNGHIRGQHGTGKEGDRERKPWPTQKEIIMPIQMFRTAEKKRCYELGGR